MTGINDLSAEGFAKLREAGFESDADVRDADPDEFLDAGLEAEDLGKCLLIRKEYGDSLSKNAVSVDSEAEIHSESGGVPEKSRGSVPEAGGAPVNVLNGTADSSDRGEAFTVYLQPRHAQWIRDVVAMRQASDESHAIEQCIRASMVNDTTRAGRRAGGSIKADDFDDGT